MKLKLNWKALGSGVYESSNGIRIHCGGLMVRTPGKSFISAYEEINRALYWKCWYIMGRNNRRAMMLFAESLQIVK